MNTLNSYAGSMQTFTVPLATLRWCQPFLPGILYLGLSLFNLLDPRPMDKKNEHDEAVNLIVEKSGCTVEQVYANLISELDEAEEKAWKSLAKYKFSMFGYWCAIWVHLNRITKENRPNPWKILVHTARLQLERKEVP